MKVFIAHGGSPLFLSEIESFFVDLGIKPIIAERQANEGEALLLKIEKSMTSSDFALVIWNQAAKDSKGNDLPSSSVVVEAGIISQKFGKRVIYIHEKGVQIPTILSGKAYETFSSDNLAPVFRRIITELYSWGDLAVGSSPNQVRLLNEAQIYDLRTIQSEDGPNAMLVYVPVGFWAIGDKSDPKVMWTLAIQQRIKNKNPELQFMGVYGIPTHDEESYGKVTELLVGFAGCKCIVRVFASHNLRASKSKEHTDAPGLGLLLAEYPDGRRSLLVACASKPGSLRIDSAFSVTDLQIYDHFQKWYALQVAKLGFDLDLSSDKTIRRDLQNIWKKQHNININKFFHE